MLTGMKRNAGAMNEVVHAEGMELANHAATLIRLLSECLGIDYKARHMMNRPLSSYLVAGTS